MYFPVLDCSRKHFVVQPHTKVVEESAVNDCLANLVHEPHPERGNKIEYLIYWQLIKNTYTLMCRLAAGTESSVSLRMNLLAPQMQFSKYSLISTPEKGIISH